MYINVIVSIEVNYKFVLCFEYDLNIIKEKNNCDFILYVE